MVESVCPNGHQWAGEMMWLLPLVFPEDIPLTAECPDCGSPLRVLAGTYERQLEDSIYRRVGPPDPSVAVPVG